MCCLKYEESTYEELTRKLPAEGDLVQTPGGVGEVLHVNVLRQLLKVGVRQNEKGDVEITEYPLDEIEIVKRKRNRGRNAQNMDQEEKKQLEALEQDHGGR